MIADRNMIYDGQNYEAGDELPDLGKWDCVGTEDNKRFYEGFSEDVDKLPKYDTLGTGSTALCYDTGDLYKFHSKTNQWYKL